MGDCVEERIRLLLKSVLARTQFRTTPIPTAALNPNQSASVKPDTHLLAQALAMASTSEQTLPPASTPTVERKPGGSIYDCNICFSLSKDPVLARCGHLFCWPCFYCLPYADSYSSKECPVCQSQVLHTDIIPIYGAGTESIASVKIPPRPPAYRIQIVNHPPNPPIQRLNLMFPRPWTNTTPLNTVSLPWWYDPSTDTASSSTSSDGDNSDTATSTTSTDGDMDYANSVSHVMNG